MSKGSNSTTTDSSNTPNPAALAAYNDLLSRVTSVSLKPYQAYGGEEIAGINSQQQAGFGNINSVAGGFAPYGAQAGENIAGGTSAVTGEDIQQYMDPYTQSVIDAT